MRMIHRIGINSLKKSKPFQTTQRIDQDKVKHRKFLNPVKYFIFI